MKENNKTIIADLLEVATDIMQNTAILETCEFCQYHRGLSCTNPDKIKIERIKAKVPKHTRVMFMTFPDDRCEFFDEKPKTKKKESNDRTTD